MDSDDEFGPIDEVLANVDEDQLLRLPNGNASHSNTRSALSYDTRTNGSSDAPIQLLSDDDGPAERHPRPNNATASTNARTPANAAFRRAPTTSAAPAARRFASGPAANSSSRASNAAVAAVAPRSVSTSRPAAAEAIDLDEFDEDDNFDDSFLRQIEQAEAQIHAAPPNRGLGTTRGGAAQTSHSANGRRDGPSAGNGAAGGNGLVQMTLDGGVARQERGEGLLVVSANRSHSSGHTGESATRAAAGKPAGKKWDRGGRAATGPIRNRAQTGAFDDEEDLRDWDEAKSNHRLANVGLYAQGVQGSSSRTAGLGPPPGTENIVLPPPGAQYQRIDRDAAREWIYPTNMELRDYQFNIVSKALFK